MTPVEGMFIVHTNLLKTGADILIYANTHVAISILHLSYFHGWNRHDLT